MYDYNADKSKEFQIREQNKYSLKYINLSDELKIEKGRGNEETDPYYTSGINRVFKKKS